MKKFLDNNALLILLFLSLGLLGACSNPDEDIKNLNDNQLTDVIDTLYVDKNNIEIDSEQVSPDIKTAPFRETSNSINSTIESQAINIGDNDSEVAENSSSDLEATKQIIEVPNNEEVISGNEPAQTDLTVQNTPANNQLEDINSNDSVATEAEKIANTSFSEPITESLTQAETILKEILAINPAIDYANVTVNDEQAAIIQDYCQKISKRLSSVSLKLCLEANHRVSPFNTVNGLPIVISEFAPKPEREPLGRILVIGGTHGDELTSVSTAYKWISNLNKFHSGLFHWHIAPAINADSVLARPAIRPNANGVDLNRNLPTPDWEKQSTIRWEKLNKDPRKAPGNEPASEPETKWIMHEIETFKPDAIVSIHAPYGILDFDAPKLSTAPKSFGRLQLNLLGTYPGSLGNYAGIQQQIPVLTLELPNATAMPSQQELSAIWVDMIRWLRNQLSPNTQ